MESILEQLFALSETGVAVVDRGHCVLAWNPGAEQLFGWPASEVLGHDVVDLLAPEGSPFRRYVGSALLGDVVQAVPVMLRHRAGGVVELLLTCRGTLAMPDDHPTALLFLDPTPRHQTIAATLAQRTRELQRIIGAFPDLFFWADADGRVLDYQAGSEVNFALSPYQFLGRRPAEFLGPDVGPRVQTAIESALKDHRTVPAEYTLPSSAGARHFEARVVPIGPDRVVVVVRDITPQRRLEEQLRQKERLEAIGRLAGGVAHDFNNLLTIVGGCVESLRDELAGSAAGMNLLEELASAGQKAASLVRNLLAFGRGQATIPRTVDLNALVLDNVRLLGRLVRKNVTISVDLAREQVWVLADPVHLEQVLYNLCANARDAMPDGGRLTIGTELRPADTPEGGQLAAALVVADTGVGMTPETLERAFEPFYTTSPRLGTGLGLATAHGIVTQAGGRIDVASTVGKGSTFSVVLPYHRPESPAESWVTPAALPAAGGSETVLIVDDDPGVRNVLARTLRKQGYRVLEAEGTETGLRLYQEHHAAIRLVVSDVVMPGRSGYELATELRRRHASLPIVLMSGYQPERAFGGAPLPLGVVSVGKPLGREELLRVVRAAIDAAPDGGDQQNPATGPSPRS